MMIQDILEFARKHTAEGKKVALVTVTATKGSSPASAGQVMAVLADGVSMGTVGGGATEYGLIQRAVEALSGGEAVFSFSIDHAESGMVCGGSMSGFGNVLGNENQLVIFGGGHVAQSLAPLAVATGFFVTVVEDRPDLAEAFSGVRYVLGEPGEYGDKLRISGSAYAVICTRGHRTDDQALRFCLSQPLRYTGMIGSQGKVKAVYDRLRGEGYDEGLLEKVYAPVGLNIAGAVPAEIAVAIMAEILLVKNGGTPQHKKTMGA